MSAVAIQGLLKMWTEHSLKLQNMKWSSREGQGEPELHHRAGCMVWTLSITLLKMLTSRYFRWGVKTFLSSELTEFLQGHDKYLSGSCVIRFFLQIWNENIGSQWRYKGFWVLPTLTRTRTRTWSCWVFRPLLQKSLGYLSWQPAVTYQGMLDWSDGYRREPFGYCQFKIYKNNKLRF